MRIIHYGFVASTSDPCRFISKKGGAEMHLCLYANDLLVASSIIELLLEVKEMIGREFRMRNLGRMDNFPGLQAIWDTGGIMILH